MQKFRDYIEKITPINDTDWELFSSKLVQRVFTKKSLLLNIGSIENHISFIEKGIVRFLIPKEEEEKEITFGFCFVNEFVSAYDSFLTQIPSTYQIEALTDTTIWSIAMPICKKYIPKPVLVI